MATVTLTAPQAAADYPVCLPDTGIVAVTYGVLTVASNPLTADTNLWNMCKLPANSIVTSGWFFCSNLDNNASGTLAVTIGVTENTDLFGSFTGTPTTSGVLDDTGITGYKNALGVVRPLLTSTDNAIGTAITGTLSTFSTATTVVVKPLAQAASFNAGSAAIVLYYTRITTNTNP